MGPVIGLPMIVRQMQSYVLRQPQEVSQSGRDDEERSFEESFDTALGTSSSPTDTSAMM